MKFIAIPGLFNCLNARVFAQDNSREEEFIELSGKVSCIDPIEGSLGDATVYNKSRVGGFYTNNEGVFSIKIGENDTIAFSTI